MLLRVTSSKNEKTKSWSGSRSKLFYLNDILYNPELFQKDVGLLNFLVLDIDLALKRTVYDHEITQHLCCVMLFC